MNCKKNNFTHHFKGGPVLSVPSFVRLKKVTFTALIISLFVSSCKKSEKTEDETVPYDVAAMLNNLSDNLIVPDYQTFQKATDSLESSITQFTNAPDISGLDKMSMCWKEALLKWQRVSFYQIGPAETVLLTDNLNLYPVDTVIINSNIDLGEYNLGSVSNYKAKGFQAIDYLLHGVGNSKTEILAMYTSDSLSTNRLNYLKDIISDLTTKINTVVDEWSSSYSSTFKKAQGNEVSSSISLMLNAFNLHFEKQVRDGKIGLPAGARSFSQTPFPDHVEGYYHGTASLEFAIESMKAIRDFYTGTSTLRTNGEGFDDYLTHLKVEKDGDLLDNKIKEKIDEIINSLGVLNSPLKEEVISNQQYVIAVWELMQELVILTKVDMTSALNVKISYVDNDGD